MRFSPLLLVLISSAVCAQPVVKAPSSAKAGSEIAITITGSRNPRDFVSIVAKTTREGAYDAYDYVREQGAVKLAAPATPGDYEIRVLAADSPYATLARQALRVEAVPASVTGPDQVAAGAKFQLQWTGPNNARDYVALGDATRKYIVYEYTRAGSPMTLLAPDQPGAYELRYILGVGDQVIASRPITVGTVSASVSAAAQVAAGAKFPVTWKGPNNDRDFVTIVKSGTADKLWGAYAYTKSGATLELRAPDEAGNYEIRYLTGQAYTTLAVTKITVASVTASLQAAGEAVAGVAIPVTWKGPNNPQDYITIVPKAARDGESGNYEYTSRGNPASVPAPLTPGDYELRYSTGQTQSILARTAIRITPSKEEPGSVSVTSSSTVAPGAGVEIILDASGSMLQRIGAQRRIDIAKQTLTKLTSTSIPSGTPFALRVFGREVDSCQTDLDIPVGPLDAAVVGKKIAALEAKNNAKTPIGASLEKVADDLQSVRGERLVILLTDGEETCGGDPAAAIASLKKTGTSVRINIVGFAIDDAKLAAAFRHWSDTGDGAYFDAKDAAGLGAAMLQALQPGYEIVNAQNRVIADGVAGGEPVKVLPGNYTARLKGQNGKSQAVTVKAKETTAVKF